MGARESLNGLKNMTRRKAFSSPEPVVSWSRGRETRGSPLVCYELSRVALGTRMEEK